MQPQQPSTQKNDPSKKGQLASKSVTFGLANRFCIFAVHTRLDAIQWFVTDAETPDSDNSPSIVAQEDDFASAVMIGAYQ